MRTWCEAVQNPIFTPSLFSILEAVFNKLKAEVAVKTVWSILRSTEQCKQPTSVSVMLSMVLLA